MRIIPPRRHPRRVVTPQCEVSLIVRAAVVSASTRKSGFSTARESPGGLGLASEQINKRTLGGGERGSTPSK